MGGASYLTRLRGFGLAAEGAKRDLRGVEEFATSCILDGADRHAVGSTGNEITDVLIAEERRHGIAIGLTCIHARSVLNFVMGV